MSLLSVQPSLIAVLESRAWKFTPSRTSTKSVDALQFSLHIPRFANFYQNLQRDFCSFKQDCAYCLQLNSIRSHSNSDLFLHSKSSFCSALRKTQRPHKLCDTVKNGPECTFNKFIGNRYLEEWLIQQAVFLSFRVVFQRHLNRLEKEQAGTLWSLTKRKDKSCSWGRITW